MGAAPGSTAIAGGAFEALVTFAPSADDIPMGIPAVESAKSARQIRCCRSFRSRVSCAIAFDSIVMRLQFWLGPWIVTGVLLREVNAPVTPSRCSAEAAMAEAASRHAETLRQGRHRGSHRPRARSYAGRVIGHDVFANAQDRIVYLLGDSRA